MARKLSKFLRGKRIDPTPISRNTALADLIRSFCLTPIRFFRGFQFSRSTRLFIFDPRSFNSLKKIIPVRSINK